MINFEYPWIQKEHHFLQKLFLLNLICEWIVSWISDKHIKVNKSREFRVTRNYWYSSCERLFQLIWYPFAKKLSSIRTALAIRSKKKCHSFNYSGCPFAQNCYPFEENCHLFETLELSLQNYCQPRYCSKPLSPELFATNLSTNNFCHHLMNFHGIF